MLQSKLNKTDATASAMDHHHSGFLGHSRTNFNHLDVSTQANIQNVALSYESEDETMSRIMNREKRDTAHYNRQDIREQYCITDRGLGALENKQSLFGCLSSHRESPCSNRSSLFTACVRQKAPSDENLYELHRRHPSEYAPYPRRSRYPWGPIMSDIYHYDEDLKSSYFRRKVAVDPSRYTWMPSDDESIRMEKPRSIMENNCQEQLLNRSSASLPGKKHVSFARSHTMASFDDALSSMSSSTSHLSRITKSQERLLDVRKTDLQPITKQPEHETFSDKIKRAPMKTQATQTETGVMARKPLPLSHINLSPRTMQKVKMVSQGAQTNGLVLNGRKLTKSFSEAGNKFGISSKNCDYSQFEPIPDHEPLQRTQSDEPPRSPFILNPSPPSMFQEIPQPVTSETSSLSNQESEESACSKKEIFIDFKPQLLPPVDKVTKRALIKALSDGEILLEHRRSKKNDDCVVPERTPHSISHDNINTEEENSNKCFTPYFQNSPIRNEGIFKTLEENVYSSRETGMFGQDSIDEDFHEHLIYNKMLHQENLQEGGGIDMERWLRDECVVPSISFLPENRLSPFTSNDSLANDARDQSDGIWNESQVTVLQADSGTDNGTALSSSELTSATSPSSTTLALTPSSRRKHLLMLQHQQRSSIDTENLDEEIADHTGAHPRIVLDVADPPTVHFAMQYLSVQTAVPVRRKPEAPAPVSPQPAVVPDLLLARTDSCKTNTDVSESTTTTDDYITANSGTDSSRKSGSIQGVELYSTLHLNDGSSFDSTRGVDLLGDDMVVPSFSPSTDSRSLCNTPVPQIRTGRSTPSDDSSSSCGSYSVGASTPDILDRSARSTSRKGCPQVSDDDRSVRYSSSGYYESPMEDDSTWTPSKHRRSKDFTLDLPTTNPKNHLEVNSSSGKSNKRNSKVSPSADKPKRSKSRLRSPMQSKKSFQSKKPSPYFDEKDTNKATSDESSCDMTGKHLSNQNSPRKAKKSKENNKRKSMPRSPVNQKAIKSHADKKQPSSLPGSLSRRKASKHTNALSPDNNVKVSTAESPPDASLKKTEDSTKLKALSAESLRSVSPGSDSVFYSDPSSHTAASIDHQVHCLHCGKEVEIVTTDDPEKSISSNENHREEIVEPPAGFEDSPRAKPTGRLFKKLDRRIRSEDRNLVESKKTRYKAEVRAKSEERAAKTYRNKLRPMAKSTNNSQEELKSTDSSPSVLPGDPENEDDTGVYDVPYIDGCWIHIDERDEVNSRNSCSSPNETSTATRRDSISSTESEKDFRKRYQAVTHRMVHRKSCLEMYRRQNNKSFGPFGKRISTEKMAPIINYTHKD